MRPNDQDGGGLRATTPFRQMWCVDFEFRCEDGERPRPICMVAKEVFTGETRRLWRDELLRLKKAPFETGPDAVTVAYLASADLGCFLELGWPLPHNVFDPHVEHRVHTNGRYLPTGNGLLGALAVRGLTHIDTNDKAANRLRDWTAVGYPLSRQIGKA
jgi:DNA polymerase I